MRSSPTPCWPARSTSACIRCCPASRKCRSMRGEPPRAPVLLTSGDEHDPARARSRRGGSELRAPRQGRGRAAVSSASPSRAAFIVRRPLPYVYVAREVMRSAGIACQMFDALPLAAEPYAAALDLVLSCVSANFARGPAIALLRSPHFEFGPAADEAVRLKPDTTTRRAMFRRSIVRWPRPDISATRNPSIVCSSRGARLRQATVRQAGRCAVAWSGRCAPAKSCGDSCASSTPLRSPAPVAEHLACLLTFLTSAWRERTGPVLVSMKVGRGARGARSSARSSRCATDGRGSTTRPWTATSSPR